MGWEESYLDAVLVPSGLMVLIVYHVRLLHRVRYNPRETVIGINHIVRRAWVKCIMQDSKGNGVLAVQTIRNSIMGSTLLASTAITVGALLATLAAQRSKNGGSVTDALIVGSKSSTLLALKYVTVTVCFLLAFLFHVQSIRYASHVSFLITTPLAIGAQEAAAAGSQPNNIEYVEYVCRLLKRGTDFFSLGMRAYYFSFSLLFWLFGPIPQFVCSCIMLVLLHILDTAKEDEFHVSLLHHAHEEEEAAAAAGGAAAPSPRVCKSPEHERPPV